ncbi:MAG: PTS transporter subunit EIIB [Bacilli bacterium]|nr:PTS transporter subunit EIIB [Bacilli bacterium]MCF0125772.1 PTS transporter subunit EIIB [Clostridia bacterium]
MKVFANTFKDDLNAFLRSYALYICLAIVAIIAIVVVIILLKNKKPIDMKKEQLNKTSDDEWLVALGGKENIKEASAMGSRLTVVLNDQELLNQDKLKELGVSNIMTMSNKVILVIEDHAELVANKINK